MNSKKVLLSVVAIALIFSVVSMMGFATSANAMDVNKDGKVTVLDAKLVLQVVAGLIDATPDDATEADATAADATVADATVADATEADATEADATPDTVSVYDVNGDGKISVLDAITVLRAVAEVDATDSTATEA